MKSKTVLALLTITAISTCTTIGFAAVKAQTLENNLDTTEMRNGDNQGVGQQEGRGSLEQSTTSDELIEQKSKIHKPQKDVQRLSNNPYPTKSVVLFGLDWFQLGAIIYGVLILFLFERILRKLKGHHRSLKITIDNINSKTKSLSFYNEDPSNQGISTEKLTTIAHDQKTSLQELKHMADEINKLKSQLSTISSLIRSNSDRTFSCDTTPLNMLASQENQTNLHPATRITLESLIEAINNGDRNTIRAASAFSLNITRESENSLITGRAIATELEKASEGAGSFYLIEIDGKSYLFPTNRTLSGYSQTSPNKGIFEYRQDVVVEPQLIKPAILEQSSGNWIVRELGVVSVP